VLRPLGIPKRLDLKFHGVHIRLGGVLSRCNSSMLATAVTHVPTHRRSNSSLGRAINRSFGNVIQSHKKGSRGTITDCTSTGRKEPTASFTRFKWQPSARLFRAMQSSSLMCHVALWQRFLRSLPRSREHVNPHLLNPFVFCSFRWIWKSACGSRAEARPAAIQA
jgi:hypothetical protein